ncbi:MAG TPA: disulfide bond formation protein DsbA [Gammaproteobacteria bacterium]|nr:disulfide bond formation protein DsbA [Gammaproteobacteria bacterium]|tara:strand:+ start:189 stop:809 length:621 start_codon:yes stop_codon:yes gene_type:complete
MVRIAIGVLFGILFGSTYAETNFEEGKHYERIIPEVATHTDGKVEVVEVFWYGCHHCFNFEPYLNKWIPSLPDEVVFRRMPAIFAENWKPHSRAFYTAEAIGVLDKIHAPLFEAMHEQNRKIRDVESLGRFFSEQGISEETFQETYNSFTVDNKTRQAEILSRKYGISGVPSVIVDGRYRTSARLTGGYEKMLKVIDHLISLQSSR